MMQKLVPNFESNVWESVGDIEKFKMEMRASYDPVYFWNEPRMGNLKLWDSQVNILGEFYKFDENTEVREYNELLFDAGRGGGKTTMASIILLTELYRLLMNKNPQEHYGIISGDPITLFTSAAGFTQTLNTIFPKIIALLQNSPWFMQYHNVIRLTREMIKFPKNIRIEAVGSNIKSAQGRNIKCYVAEEVNSVGTETGMLTPEELYDKISKGTSRFAKWNEGIRVAISSQTSEYDFLSRRIAVSRDKDIPGVMIVKSSSVDLNPNLTKEILEADRLRNEDSYNMEYGLGEFGGGQRYFSASTLERLNYGGNLFSVPDIHGVTRQQEFVPDFHPSDFKYDEDANYYYMAVDPAVVHDPFGISVMHKKINGTVVVDGATVFRAKKNGVISAELVKGFITKILDVIPIEVYLYDIYQYSDIREMVANRGITIEQHHVGLADWEQLKDQIGMGAVTIPKAEYIEKEFRELTFKSSGTGVAKVDHTPTGTKDCIDTICQGVTYPFRGESEKKMNKIFVGTAMQYR